MGTSEALGAGASAAAGADGEALVGSAVAVSTAAAAALSRRRFQRFPCAAGSPLEARAATAGGAGASARAGDVAVAGSGMGGLAGVGVASLLARRFQRFPCAAGSPLEARGATAGAAGASLCAGVTAFAATGMAGLAGVGVAPASSRRSQRGATAGAAGASLCAGVTAFAATGMAGLAGVGIASFAWRRRQRFPAATGAGPTEDRAGAGAGGAGAAPGAAFSRFRFSRFVRATWRVFARAGSGALALGADGTGAGFFRFEALEGRRRRKGMMTESRVSAIKAAMLPIAATSATRKVRTHDVSSCCGTAGDSVRVGVVARAGVDGGWAVLTDSGYSDHSSDGAGRFFFGGPAEAFCAATTSATERSKMPAMHATRRRLRKRTPTPPPNVAAAITFTPLFSTPSGTVKGRAALTSQLDR
jgi:hypothetical protein